MSQKSLNRKNVPVQSFGDFAEDDSLEVTRNQFDVSEILKRRYEKRKDLMLREKRKSKFKSRNS